MMSKKVEEQISADSWRQLFDCSAADLGALVSLAEESGRFADRCRIVLSGLKQEEARIALCSLAMQKERPWLNTLLATSSYLPSEKKQHSAFFVITQQWNKYLHQYNKSGHAELFEHISSASDFSFRILEQIEKTDDVSCVRFILDLLLDNSVSSISFTTRAGKSSSLENRLLVVLANLDDANCQKLVFQKWFDTRDDRLANLIPKYPALICQTLEHNLLRQLKFGGVDESSLAHASKIGRGRLETLTAEAVPILLRACLDFDVSVSRAARNLVTRLEDADAQKEILSIYLGQVEVEPAHLRVIERLAARLKYSPEQKDDQVLFKLLLRDWDAFVELDPQSKITQRIYQWASQSLRQRIALALKESSRFEWIVNVCGPEGKIKLSEMSNDDWQLLQKSLSSTSSWDEIWKLIPLMPAANAKKFLQRLQQVSWKPAESSDKESFDRLVNYANRLSTDHPPIWSNLVLWKTIDLGGPLLNQIRGGLEMWESRFAFAFDASEFFMLDKNSEVLTWALPSCLPGRFHIDTDNALTAIAASPISPLLALGTPGANVQLCDLDSRRSGKKLLHDCKSEEAGKSRIKNLSFSASGDYLMAILRSTGPSLCCNTISYQTDSWKKTLPPLPPYSNISVDNQWLLYSEFNQVHLERMDGKRSRVASIPTSFRSSTLHFLPDGSGIIRDDGRLSLYTLPGLIRLQKVRAPGSISRSFIVSEQNRYRVIGLVEPDYKWVLLDCPNKEQIHPSEERLVDLRYPPWQRSETISYRQTLHDAGVDTNLVGDLNDTDSPQDVCLILKDPSSQYLAVVHTSGKVSFWVSDLFRFAQTSAALMSESERATLQMRLHSSETSETELNWLKFIFELSGTYEHCAISIAEAGNDYVELSEFDIEIV